LEKKVLKKITPHLAKIFPTKRVLARGERFKEST